MKLNQALVLAAFLTALTVGGPVSALAADTVSDTQQSQGGGHHHPPRLTEAQMKSIHNCAKQKGVDLPDPPPMRDDGQKDGNPPPPPSGEGKGGPGHGDNGKGPHGGPELTDAQRTILDSCFKEAGISKQ